MPDNTTPPRLTFSQAIGRMEAGIHMAVSAPDRRNALLGYLDDIQRAHDDDLHASFRRILDLEWKAALWESRALGAGWGEE